MAEYEQQKYVAISAVKGLCAHCHFGRQHNCPMQDVVQKIERLSGVPLIVNGRFTGMVHTKI